MLDERVATLESSIVVPPAGDLPDDPIADADHWLEAVAAAARRRPGRVVVAESGDGVFVAGLQRLGLDAYGVEPRDDLARKAALAGVETRADEAASHPRP